jgi:hypothetical protein
LAEECSNAVTGRGHLAAEITESSPNLKAATDLRNQGMGACRTGRRGREMIEQAAAALKSRAEGAGHAWPMRWYVPAAVFR